MPALPADFCLPTPDEGVDGMLRMADVFGDRQTFQFLGMMNGKNICVGETRAVLAARQVRAQQRSDPSLDWAAARRRVAKVLGYHGTLASNFNRLANPGRTLLAERGDSPADTTDFRLPTPDEGVDGMLRMADVFGDRQTYQFLDLTHGKNSVVGEARAILAARQVVAQQRSDPSLDWAAARLQVARKLGYHGTHVSNFNRLANPGRVLLAERGDL